MMECFHPLPTALWTIFTIGVFVFGACIGSFLNVCIFRIPRELAVYRPNRSFCPHCQNTIAWYDNIPLLSILLLGGRCRRCRAPIHPRYFVVEALVALLFTLVWLQFCPPHGGTLFSLDPISDWKLVPVFWLVISGLVLGTFVDFDFLIIPDRVTLGGIVAGLLLSALVPSMHDQPVWHQGLLSSLIGAASGWGLLWLVAIFGRWIFRRDAMGFGDVKLLGAIGAFFGWRAILFTVMVSSLFGSIVGIALVISGRKKLQSRIPYGPYMALAALIWMFWGRAIWALYVDLMFPPLPPLLPPM